MKVPMTVIDSPFNQLEPCRVSVGVCHNGHVLFMKVNDESVTVFTDTESLTRLRDELTKYLEEQ